MIGFAVLTWGVAIFLRGGTALTGTTSYNNATFFIPAWLTLTIGTVVISMWFTKFLLTAEKYRDTEPAPSGSPAHSH